MPERLISVVIPVRNGAATIGRCLEAALASRHPRFEVVVVDDASEDGSASIVEHHPVRLVRLERHAGVSRARNAGAEASAGDLLFFTDADCLLLPDTLAVADAAYGRRDDLVLGGTYTQLPWDRDFFSAFQSVAIHHAETRRETPDYVASHALAIDAALFRRSGGFRSDRDMGIAPSVEDVELSHRLRRSGCELAVHPGILVRHVFRFTLARSIGNAVRKARHWTRYSLANRDLLGDCGAASRTLKANVVLSLAAVVAIGAALARGTWWPLLAAAGCWALDLLLSRRLLAAWREARGTAFGAAAALYYLSLYAAAVGFGATAGAALHLWSALPPRRARSCTARFGTHPLSS